MTDELILDTLYPPALDQLLQDMAAVGATGVAVYVWRPGGTGNWTPALAQGIRDAGKKMFPIIVPAVDGGDINGQLGAAQAFGFTSGPITLDLEPPNMPPAAWEETFDRAATANGFKDFDYGTPSNLGQYTPDDQNWVATWIRTGQLSPLPVRPAGWAGWQFVDDITINGRQYDASVIASSIFSGGVPVTDPITDTVVPASPVSGRVWPDGGSTWLDWDTLGPVGTAPRDLQVKWNEAKLQGGTWYLRIMNGDQPGSWALRDADVDDGGHDPTFFRPVPPPAPPPPTPTPPPVPPVVDQAARDSAQKALDALRAVKAALDGAGL